MARPRPHRRLDARHRPGPGLGHLPKPRLPGRTVGVLGIEHATSATTATAPLDCCRPLRRPRPHPRQRPLVRSAALARRRGGARPHRPRPPRPPRPVAHLHQLRARAHHRTDGGGYDELNQLYADVQTALDELRETLRQLRTGVTEDKPLAVVGQELVDRFARTDRRGRVVHGGPPRRRLPVPVENELLRILQEALNNVDKHAKADHVDVVWDVRRAGTRAGRRRRRPGLRRRARASATAPTAWSACASGPTSSAAESPSTAPRARDDGHRVAGRPAPRRRSMLRILLADDHQILREGIRRGLESAGEAVVGEAANGEEAVDLARETKPDIVLMDLSMPVLDGVEATRRITDELPDVKVVVLTMHDDPGRTRAAIAAGASGYLTKGTSFAEVLETIRLRAAGGDAPQPRARRVDAAGRRSEPRRRRGDLLTDRQVEILQKIANGTAPSRWPATWASPRRRCTTTSTPSTAGSTRRASPTPCCQRRPPRHHPPGPGPGPGEPTAVGARRALGGPRNGDGHLMTRARAVGSVAELVRWLGGRLTWAGAATTNAVAWPAAGRRRHAVVRVAVATSTSVGGPPRWRAPWRSRRAASDTRPRPPRRRHRAPPTPTCGTVAPDADHHHDDDDHHHRARTRCPSPHRPPPATWRHASVDRPRRRSPRRSPSDGPLVGAVVDRPAAAARCRTPPVTGSVYLFFDVPGADVGEVLGRRPDGAGARPAPRGRRPLRPATPDGSTHRRSAVGGAHAAGRGHHDPRLHRVRRRHVPASTAAEPARRPRTLGGVDIRTRERSEERAMTEIRGDGGAGLRARPRRLRRQLRRPRRRRRRLRLYRDGELVVDLQGGVTEAGRLDRTTTDTCSWSSPPPRAPPPSAPTSSPSAASSTSTPRSPSTGPSSRPPARATSRCRGCCPTGRACSTSTAR